MRATLTALSCLSSIKPNEAFRAAWPNRTPLAANRGLTLGSATFPRLETRFEIDVRNSQVTRRSASSPASRQACQGRPNSRAPDHGRHFSHTGRCCGL
ncbi:hypothetical protein MESS4_710046 [Mesorhizobium sp. STM 4661]|nr:hypothetical protein MESS4_710046 [Mesorhizobium sp. STM 4661]